MRTACSSVARPGRWLMASIVAVIVLAGGWWFTSCDHGAGLHPPSEAETVVAARPAGAATTVIELPQASWSAAGVTIEPIRRGPLPQTVELTGKISLNEDRVAHIFPLVEGQVADVKIHLGERVQKGDLLVVVKSKEVGQTMLQLFQDRLQREFTQTKNRWTQMVSENTLAMIALMRDGASIDVIEKELTNRPMGDYRDQLMTGYISCYKARQHLERLAPLAKDGTIPGKQLLEAESDWKAARATLQSSLEQLQQDAQQAAIVSTQAVRELETRVAVDETNLKILGFRDDQLENVNPSQQGESLSHYPILAPFDGTIISKDVVLLERVHPATQILSIADLSSVWVTTDIYEEHLPLLRELAGRTITLRNAAWPDQTFEAEVFYSGDLVEEASRTIAMRAVADNREGLLKPGMFVNVELQSVARNDVLQVPLTAVQEYEGRSFVFIHLQDDRFERRDVSLGVRNRESVEVRSGLQLADQVVTDGGFALKSRMLAELLSE